ncbi:hypothetical protein D3C87_1957820 [compost metagenome]
MLTGHQRSVADIIRFRMGCVASREDVRVRGDLQQLVDTQACLSITFAINLRGQWMGFNARGPDHGG